MFNKSKIWPTLMAIAMVAMLTGCKSEDEAYNDKAYYMDNDVTYNGIYDGEWKVNRQVVDTARLVMNGPLRIRLPERYLLGLCFDDPSIAQPSNTPIVIQMQAQGYGKLSDFNSFFSDAKNNEQGEMRFSNCSFGTIVGTDSCVVTLVSAENATAVWQKDTDQWTLVIPINALMVSNLTTGQQTEKALSGTQTLYYHTKKRIE